MTDELKQAAERLRRIEAGVPIKDVYDGVYTSTANYLDLLAVTSAYLANHPEDDDEKADLIRVKKYYPTLAGRWIFDADDFTQYMEFDCGQYGRVKCYTMGDVRRFAKCLGITAKEKL